MTHWSPIQRSGRHLRTDRPLRCAADAYPMLTRYNFGKLEWTLKRLISSVPERRIRTSDLLITNALRSPVPPPVLPTLRPARTLWQPLALEGTHPAQSAQSAKTSPAVAV